MAPPPPATMKVLHLTTSGGSGGSNSDGFKSSISSLDLRSASAVLIDVEETSLCDERLQRQRESPAASVSLSSTVVSAMSAGDRYRDMLLPSGEGQTTLPARLSIPRRPGTVKAWPRGGRPRAASPPSSPGDRRLGRVMDGSGDAVMRGAGRDTSATCCSTSSTTAETASDRALPGSAADDDDLSRDLPDHHDVQLPQQPTRRHRGRSFVNVTQQCHCRSTSGIAGDRKFRLYRKHFADDDADNRSRSVAMSISSLQRLPERYILLLLLLLFLRPLAQGLQAKIL